MRQLITTIVVSIVATFAMTACPDDGDEVAVGCDTTYPDRVEVEEAVGLLLTACETRDGMSGRIKNESAAVLELTAAAPISTTWRAVPGSGPTDHIITGVVGASRAPFGSYWLYPRQAVVVSSAFGEPQITVQPQLAASATAFAISYLAEWFHGLGKSPFERAFETLQTCVQGIGQGLTAPTDTWQEVFRTTIRTLPACNQVVAFVTGSSDDAGRVADDVLRQSSRFRGVWDDALRAVGYAARLFPR